MLPYFFAPECFDTSQTIKIRSLPAAIARRHCSSGFSVVNQDCPAASVSGVDCTHTLTSSRLLSVAAQSSSSAEPPMVSSMLSPLASDVGCKKSKRPLNVHVHEANNSVASASTCLERCSN
jgi:hypothetical protein